MEAIKFNFDKLGYAFNIQNLKLKQRDTRELKFNFYDNGEALNLDGYYINMYWKNPDETIVSFSTSSFIVENNTATVTLNANCTNIAGVAQFEIVLSKDDNIDCSWTQNVNIVKSCVSGDGNTKNIAEILEQTEQASKTATNFVNEYGSIYGLKNEVDSLSEEISTKANETDLETERTRIDNLDATKATKTEVAVERTRIDNLDATKATKTEVAVERARIDNLMALPEGSTTNDARLEDIRNKANGEQADTPGNAVREQFNVSNNHIRNIQNDIYNTTEIKYEKGGFDGSDLDVELAFANYIRSNKFSISSDTTIIISENIYVSIYMKKDEITSMVAQKANNRTVKITDTEAEYRIVMSDLEVTENVTSQDAFNNIKIYSDDSMYNTVKTVRENYKKDYQPVVNFTVDVNIYNQDNSKKSLQAQDDEELAKDWGVLLLPTTYKNVGEPTQLIIMCHGAGTTVKENTQTLTNPVPNLVKLGYAVMDMNGLPSVMAGEETGLHFGCPVALQSYLKGYEYVTQNYNVTKEVFVMGGSMGGLTSMAIVQSGVIPVKAQASMCGVVDHFKQAYCKPWSTGQREKIAKYFAFEDKNATYQDINVEWEIGGIDVDESLNAMTNRVRTKDYIVPNGDMKIILTQGYSYMLLIYGNDNNRIPGSYWISPSELEIKYTFGRKYKLILKKTDDTDISSLTDLVSIQEKVCSVAFTNGENPTEAEIQLYKDNLDKVHPYYPIRKFCLNWNDNLLDNIGDTTEDTQYKALIKQHPVPIKIWHNENDTVVAPRYSQYFVNAIKNFGGIAELRTFSSGGHNAWDNGVSVTMKDCEGNDISVKTTTYELVQWIRRF